MERDPQVLFYKHTKLQAGRLGHTWLPRISKVKSEYKERHAESCSKDQVPSWLSPEQADRTSLSKSLKPAPSNRTFSAEGNVPYLRCPKW